MFSFLTDTGVYTSTRVMQGGSNSVAYCQSTVQQMFVGQLYKTLLAWLDDLLGYEKAPSKLLKALEEVLEVCLVKGLKLNPKKCKFFVKEAKWCGRIISGGGVKHDPKRVEALQQLPAPVTGADLQQYLCVINWMCMSIPGFNVLTHGLSKIMEQVYEKANGKRTKQAVAAVPLVDFGSSEDHLAALQATKEAVGCVLELSHPKPEMCLCVVADASEAHWGAVITQVSPCQLEHALEDQDHEPLMFLSGTFTGAASRWAIVEKEAYAIVETLVRADYLLHPAAGFHLFTDHRNLKFIFNPSAVVASVPKYTAQTLERWALLLMGYTYVIHDIPGEDNVWADLLSRWGSPLKSICAIKQDPLMISPLRSVDFVWPTMHSLTAVQEVKLKSSEFPDLEISSELEHQVPRYDGSTWSMRVMDGVIWIPDDATDMQLRLCVCAHAGLAGHRGVGPTTDSLKAFCVWSDMVADIKFFVDRCLHCASVSGGNPRPFGEALHSSEPNGLIHWDFLHMGQTTTGEVYLLVIKDDASKMVWIFSAKAATAAFVKDCLLQWFSVFGVCLHYGVRPGHPLQEPSRGRAATSPWSAAPLHYRALSVGERHGRNCHAASPPSVPGVSVRMVYESRAVA